MFRSVIFRVFFGLGALCLLASSLLAQELARPSADARIVIFDASGSMAAKNFNSNTDTRMKIAREVLIEVYDELLEIGDRIPTATLVFGSGFVWDDERRRNGWSSPSDPGTLNHPICQDSRIRMPASLVSSGSVQQARQLATSLSPSGMTPIHVSLLDGLRAFRGDIQDKTLQFVLISDMDSPNCLHGATDQCEALLPELSRISVLGGSVSTIVFETPSSNILETFDECLSVVRIPIPVTDPDIGGIVEEAFSLVTVMPTFVAGGPNNLDPNGVDPSTARLRFAESGERVPIASGPHGTFELPTGEFMVTGTIDDTTFVETTSVRTNTDIPIEVSPGTLVISARGGAGPILEEVVISRPSGPVVRTLQNYKAGTPLNLANGTYNVMATLPNGASAGGSIPLRLGSTRELTLDFASVSAPLAPTAREVLIDVRFSGPTLDVDGVWPPLVTLVGPGPNGPRLPLSSSGYAGQLDFGTYVVEIEAETPHRISYEVIEGDGPMSLQLNIPAGWFTALSPSQRTASFELRDSQGEPIFRMDGERIQHALPEGRYTLVLLSSDGRHVERPFRIRLGRETLIDDF